MFRKLFIFAALSTSLFAQKTPINSAAIKNSTVDSTPIGATTATTGAFTSLQVESNPGVFTTQGAYFEWNLENVGQGETDEVNVKGNGVGGFDWFNIATGGSINTPIATLSGTGDFAAVSSLTAPTITGTNITASNSLNGTLNGNVNGNVNGTATNANNLSAMPNNCNGSNGPFAAIGVNQQGNVQGCVATPFPVGTNNPVGVAACQISAGGSCDYNVTFSYPTVNTDYAAVCGIRNGASIPVSGKPRIAYLNGKYTTYVSVHIDTVDGNSAVVPDIDCAVIP